MEIATTKMSQNGQVVIPAEIRKKAKLDKNTQFLVFNENGDILLKKIQNTIKEDLILADSIRRGEEDIKAGRYTKADTNMSEKEIHKLLMD